MIPIPIGDENPTSRRPVVNLSIIALNGAFFLWFNVVRGHGFFLLSQGDLDRFALLPGDPAPWRFLTSMFMHGDPLHLLFNMWFLHIFGDNVEDKIGRGKYLAIYLAWGVLASLAFLAFGKPVGEGIGPLEKVLEREWERIPLVGASGAIAGVMGTYVVFFPRARIRTIWWVLFIFQFRLPSLVVIGMYFLKDLVLGLGPGSGAAGGVAYMAHIGGMVAGIATGLALKPILRRKAGGAWDRDTGFAPAAGPAPPRSRPSLDSPPVFPTPDLRDQIVGAVLDDRNDLALELYREWASRARREVLPAGIEIEIAHELLRRGAVEEAMDAYRRYLGSHPRAADAPEAKFRMGLIHSRAGGDPVRAREWLLQAVEEHPDPDTVAYARRELRELEGG